jgi:hypothetical protein
MHHITIPSWTPRRISILKTRLVSLTVDSEQRICEEFKNPGWVREDREGEGACGWHGDILKCVRVVRSGKMKSSCMEMELWGGCVHLYGCWNKTF